MVEKGSIIVDVIPRRLGPWGWPNAAGISGRMALERVAECRRNQRPNVRRNRWPNAVGISGRMGLEYARYRQPAQDSVRDGLGRPFLGGTFSH
jgi:hypothetical protein